jgi:glycine hydroxymethyltransferase
MGEDEMRRIGGWLRDALRSRDDAGRVDAIRVRVEQLCARFPVPGL